MNKRVLKGIVIGFSIIFLSIAAMYVGLAYYYANGFSYGTWINGVYCTGKSINEINDELLKQYDYAGLTIMDRDGRSYSIPAGEVGLAFNFYDSLSKYLSEQNPYLWGSNLLEAASGGIILEPYAEYNERAYEKIVDSLPFFTGKTEEEREVRIAKGDEGYYLINERTHVLNEQRARDMIKDAFEGREAVLDLEAAGCYEDLPLSSEMERDISLWDKLSAYQDCGIVYRLDGEDCPVDSGVVCDFLELDEEGRFVLDEQGNLCTDEEKVFAFIDRLADEYDTVGKKRLFHATRGGTVTVEGGTYGNKIDRQAEKEYLLDAFYAKRKEVHEPAYLQRSLVQGEDDIGDTYIEVDMSKQMMYFYKNGELLIETPVVTGNTSLRRGTPQGTNFVYGKERNRVLRGEGYESPVKYWMPVYRGVGIHDASWRNKFGGEIYKTNGSHGCINTPLKEVAELFDMVEVGTPCVMFY